tara:strand:+ start:1259 stop:2833 length:1575 start_codon:yes stop_codon:yes gene_type:complete
MKKLVLIFSFVSQVNAQFTNNLNYIDINDEEINPFEILSQGKYLYLDFFSTTCGACNNVANEIVNAYESYGENNSNIFFLGIEYNSTAIECNNFSQLHNSNFPIIAGLEGGADIFSLYNQSGYPSGKLISPSGEIQADFSYFDIINLTESLSEFVQLNDDSSICDLVTINSIELHDEINNALLLNVYSDTPYSFPYPSFYLLNDFGDTLAYETVNYYGLSGESSHILQIVNNTFEWENELNLQLFSNFQETTECIFQTNLNQINFNGCSDSSAYNFNIYSQSEDYSNCVYESCNELNFEVLTNDIILSDSGNGEFSLEIPILNNNNYYLAYPMSELQILNDENNNFSCINCDFNVMNNPWQALDTNYYNVNFTYENITNNNYEAKLYLENFENNGQSFSGCVFDELIFFNLNPNITGCTDENAVNYDPTANIDNNLCLYTSDVCPSININLNTGWNLVGFSCSNEINVGTAMSPYVNKLIIVKDNLGNAYLPDWDFNGIGVFERGYGYQLKINQEINNFNLCNE